MLLQLSQQSEKEYQRAVNNPIPDNVRAWTVSDVSRWLDTLELRQYIAPFAEGAVDGPFLMELREEDLVQVLGIKHKLHVMKILSSREKLKPLSQQELRQKEVVLLEVSNVVECCQRLICSQPCGCVVPLKSSHQHLSVASVARLLMV